jgi:hypothetical protein
MPVAIADGVVPRHERSSYPLSPQVAGVAVIVFAGGRVSSSPRHLAFAPADDFGVVAAFGACRTAQDAANVVL